MRKAKNPFGDGHAAQRIAEVLSRALVSPIRTHVQEVGTTPPVTVIATATVHPERSP